MNLSAIWFIEASYFVAAALFIIGLKRMSSPKTARDGIVWAGAAMVLATLVTFLYPDMGNYLLIIVAIAIGGALAWITGKRVQMTAMPQMIALYNGMGGGAAAAIAAVELFKGGDHSLVFMVLAVLGGVIGSVAFSGSLIAFAKLQGWLNKSIRLPGQHIFNALLALVIVALGAAIVAGNDTHMMVSAFFIAALVLGVTITVPIGGADMPVVISLYNALTGLAVAFEGFVIGNAAMIIAGTVVGAAGTLLTQLMAKAMNRSLANVLFSGFGDTGGTDTGSATGTMKEIEAGDAGVSMAYAKKVIVIPGYGLAVAQAQHKVWELAQQLTQRGVQVKFAIHPVAGRMPGHMNVLLAEAGVPYDMIFDLEEVNSEFASADVALVIGANDVVNPAARNNPSSPIFGMPILDADKAAQVIVIKRGKGTGFSGIENELFFLDNCRMLYGDGQDAASRLIAAVKAS
jgi:H+-translocating NAD(P) transhydrogenase subunit beta